MLKGNLPNQWVNVCMKSNYNYAAVNSFWVVIGVPLLSSAVCVLVYHTQHRDCIVYSGAPHKLKSIVEWLKPKPLKMGFIFMFFLSSDVVD